MNEFYLEKASVAQKRYTLCHEIGHSFGLAHTDEDFFNPDLGNCMDYTTTPEANMSPDESNFLFLKDLYGTIPERRRDLTSTAPQAQKERDGRGIPEDVRAKLREVVPRLESRLHGNAHHDEWRLLRQSKTSETYASSLGNGWAVHVSKLLVAVEDM